MANHTDMKRSVYLETSIVSYYTARPSRDLVIAAWQEVTHEIWPVLQSDFDRYISALVIQEASRGDKEAAEKRINALSEIPVLELTDQARELAKSLITSGAIPATSEEDALHIAVASLNGIEFLLTWNFSHINNAFKKSGIIRVIEDHGLVPPEICSPEELIGD
jgi:predicted nucleic acid-binding protein